MLKMLALKQSKTKKNNAQHIAIICNKFELSLLGRDDTKQAKSLIFTVVPLAEYVSKVQNKKLKDMLLEPSLIKQQ